MGGVAPIARFALAYSAGTAVGLAGAPIWIAPLVLFLALLAPNRASPRPDGARLLAVVAVAGLVAAVRSGPDPACTRSALVGGRVTLEGRFLVTPRSGSAPFVRADGCGAVTVVLPAAWEPERTPAGRLLRVTGVWREGRVRPWLRANEVEAARATDGVGGGADAGVGSRPPDRAVDVVRWSVVRWRDGLIDRIGRLYGERAPLVAALVLARREGLDPGVRDAFAVTGIAHLLAISGFHVGVVAGLLFALVRGVGVGRRGSGLIAAALAWAYVGLIGFPDAACRAALILTLVALAHVRGTPPSQWGGLAAALLFLVLIDPSNLASPGFQLSFAGAAGLVAWAGPATRALGRRLGPRSPHALTSGLAAGGAATLATLPVVAWHFERVSLVGIPMTLAATPLVSLALPGALASVALDFVWKGGAGFLAGGVGLLLDLLLALAALGAEPAWASVRVGRPSVVAGGLGVLLAVRAARRPGVGGRTRRLLIAAWVVTGVVAWPALLALEGRGSLELLVIDVGQGDAVALRSPAGRWLLVDAGPPVDGPASEHPVVRALADRGVGRLEAVVITHADADHFGGAEAVLEALSVSRVLDPALPAPKPGYLALLGAARARGTPWSAARAGDAFDLDGVRLRVLHPPDSLVAQAAAEAEATGGVEANDLSVVLLVEWRAFSALLTGDAYVGVERAVADEVGDIDVLKVGHHGSATSSDSTFLARTAPEVALVSVGARNRYGHPAPEVLGRLEAVGARVHRTDRHGTIRVRVGRDGIVRVRGERGGG